MNLITERNFRMTETKDAQLSSIILMFRFLIAVFIALLVYFFERLPQLGLPMSIFLLSLGVFAFVYGMQTTKRYKKY